jgi:hypothetical protein
MNTKSKRGNYSLTGVPALVDQISVGKIIDRGYPDYDFPRDLALAGDSDIRNYIQFVKANKDSISFESFHVGSTRQIHLQKETGKDGYNSFQIQVIKSGMQVMGANGTTSFIEGAILDEKGKWNENAMSAAIVIRYDDFVYYEGADQEIEIDPNGDDILLDTIGPTARAAGKVDVAALNHHGHGITQEFVKLLDPPVSILQGWCSDQPRKKNIQFMSAPVAETGKPREIFATKIFPERLEALGSSLSKLFVSTSGHVVVRVHPKTKAMDGNKQTFEVFVLDGNRKVQSYHGHYPVREKQ